ncbi:PhzF family phenazine biosynthesis protein [Lactobacillus colini]|uniref:PhzF family phenazine biosynthesis protein n=1 Tax=Lactobacillus colini TaxID=1819254 RepID=A0ABS4MHB8_9LACO|nr:PhzF family phenazine biosynthesis protein [Lactobacillus colini]MBP2058744.1 PhzF family phenazine biosynthesis protein [Lactobacillus colini]
MKIYIVDAFTDQLFKGNPAAVCLVDKWPSEEIMKNIALENRFSETAFAIKQDDNHYLLRWFTPGGEIDLCGHATLATAFVIFKNNPDIGATVTFTTSKSGDLTVTKIKDRYAMKFPAYKLKPIAVTDQMTEAFGVAPSSAYLGRDLLCVFDKATDVTSMKPDQDKLKKLPGLLQHATAQGNEYDCVSRSFAPKLDVDEDPVCGSGHCHIIPYWSDKLGKKEITAYQASDRSGVLYCEDDGDSVVLAGDAVLYSSGELAIQ